MANRRVVRAAGSLAVAGLLAVPFLVAGCGSDDPSPATPSGSPDAVTSTTAPRTTTTAAGGYSPY
jgi:hypothetical protein